MASDRELAKVLFDYSYFGNEVGDADLLLVMGGHSTQTASWAAEVYKQHKYDWVACSGGKAHQNDMLATGWSESEAEVFGKVMEEAGVPRAVILLEDQAQHTAENVTLTRALLAARGIAVKKAVLVQKPYMERRAMATAQKHWPEVAWQVTSLPGGYERYLEGRDEAETIHILVGDTLRLPLYGEKGFIVPQEMPAEVKAAMEELVRRGYDRHLPRDAGK